MTNSCTLTSKRHTLGIIRSHTQLFKKHHREVRWKLRSPRLAITMETTGSYITNPQTHKSSFSMIIERSIMAQFIQVLTNTLCHCVPYSLSVCVCFYVVWWTGRAWRGRERERKTCATRMVKPIHLQKSKFSFINFSNSWKFPVASFGKSCCRERW